MGEPKIDLIRNFFINFGILFIASIFAIGLFFVGLELYLKHANPDWKEKIYFQMYNNKYLDVIPENGEIIKKTINGENFFEYVFPGQKEQSLSARGETIPKEKKEKRILVLGVSIDFGVGLPNNKSYPFLLEEKINTLSNTPYNVLNVSVPGSCFTQNMNKLMFHYETYQPDIIIFNPWNWDIYEKGCLNLVANTAVPQGFFNMAYANGKKLYINVFHLPENLNTFLSNSFQSFDFLNYFIAGLKERASHIYDPDGNKERTMGMEYKTSFSQGTYYKKHFYIDKFLNYLHEKNIPVVLPYFVQFDIPLIDRQQQGEDEVWKDVKNKIQEQGITEVFTINMVDEYLARNLKKDDIALDECCHLNEFGHEVVSDIFLEFLVEKNLVEN